MYEKKHQQYDKIPQKYCDSQKIEKNIYMSH